MFDFMAGAAVTSVSQRDNAFRERLAKLIMQHVQVNRVE